MKPYWIKFEPMEVRRFTPEGSGEVSHCVPSPFNLSMGVTARDEADAIYLAQFVLGDRNIASISPVTDIDALDHGHVLPNMGNVFVRGVWWPRGYEGIGQHAPGRDCVLIFHAIIDVGDPEGVHKRATIQARDLADAQARLVTEYGGRIVSVWVDPAFERPR
jgi:hypothetical protein